MASLAYTSGGSIADTLIAIGEEERKNKRDGGENAFETSLFPF